MVIAPQHPNTWTSWKPEKSGATSFVEHPDATGLSFLGGPKKLQWKTRPAGGGQGEMCPLSPAAGMTDTGYQGGGVGSSWVSLR